MLPCRRERAANHQELSMDDLKQTLDKLREELTNAGKRLAELAEKAESELPAAGKRINEEYLRLQALLDSAVDKLRNRTK
jgi:hypothetical protein